MLSIIIPTYNEKNYIEKTLDLFKNKLTLPKEIIVSDDKSLDRTVEIARKYADIVLEPKKKHISIAANRNEGAKKAKGDFLVFIDSSVLVNDPDEFFKQALQNFAKDPNLVGLTGKLNVIPELETFGDRVVYPVFNLVHHIKNNILHVGEAPGKFQMIRRDAFEKLHGFREDLITGEDGDMFYRLSRIGRTMYDPRLEVFHSGRRAHAIGWPKLLSIWMFERVRIFLFDKTDLAEWKGVR